ncbi:MAG: polyprenyl synthetase family protein [Chloroflexota bacterium]
MSASSPLSNPNAGADLAALLARYNLLVRTEIERLLPDTPRLAPFYGIMAYHLGWVDRYLQPESARPGKSLRPALCLLLAEALGADLADCAPLAAGIELLHNFSLIHDDIQDRSPTRRGRPTVWSIWGEAQAITVGDSMFSLAHQAWLRAPLAERDPGRLLDIARALEDTIKALCEGQYLDVDGEGSLTITTDAYLMMIGGKTAALMGTSAWVGCRCAGGDPALLQAARTFGTELGLAFQIRDDLLGIWGDEITTGKSVSSDISSRKMSLPVVMALEHGSAEQRAALAARYAAAPVDAEDEAATRALLTEAGAYQRAADQEDEHWRAALRALDALGLEPPWEERLRVFATSLVGRSA